MSATTTTNFTSALSRIKAMTVTSFEIGLKEVFYDGETTIKIGADRHECAPLAWKAICAYLDLPADLLPEIGRHLASIVVKVLHGAGRRARNAPEILRVSHDQTGRIIAVADAKLALLSNEQVVDAVRDELADHISSETVCAQLDLSATGFELACHTSQLAVEPRPGDILNGGITIRHSQVGASSTVVLGFIHRLVCSNGMTQRICLGGKPSRTKRTKAKNSTERTLKAIRQQVRQAWVQIHDRLAGIKELLKHPLEVDELPEDLRRRWSINREVAAEIAHAMQDDELGRTYTEYDLVNALSRVATHSERLVPRYRRQLSLAAGMVSQNRVHQCSVCGNWSIGGQRGTPSLVEPDVETGRQPDR